MSDETFQLTFDPAGEVIRRLSGPRPLRTIDRYTCPMVEDRQPSPGPQFPLNRSDEEILAQAGVTPLSPIEISRLSELVGGPIPPQTVRAILRRAFRKLQEAFPELVAGDIPDQEGT